MKMYLVTAFGKYASFPFCNTDVFEDIDTAKKWADKLYEKYLHNHFDAGDTTYIRGSHYHISNGKSYVTIKVTEQDVYKKVPRRKNV